MKKILTIIAISLVAAGAYARQPHSGYRGFLEWSSDLRSEKFAEWDFDGETGVYRESTFYWGFTTSHGYQINPMFFAGAGFGLERCGKIDNWVAPVFVQGRADFLFSRFTPFADIRIGYNIAEGGGIYFSPTVGYRFNWGRKVGVNIGAGLTLAGYTAEHYEGSWIEPDHFELNYIGKKQHIRPYFSLRIGFDF